MPGPSLTRVTLTIWRGLAAEPANRSVEATSVIRMPHVTARSDDLRRCSGAGQVTQRRAAQPLHGPLAHRLGADRAVEADRGRVPVQHPPLEPAVPATHADGCELSQQGLADPTPAHHRRDVQVFEIDTVTAKPGREVQEPERESDHLVTSHCHVRERGRLEREQCGTHAFGSGSDLIERMLILGEFPDQLQYPRHVSGPGWPDRDVIADAGHEPTSEPASTGKR